MINGFGIGTDHFGGFSEKASVRHEWIMPLPEGLTYLDAAKIGTAGYTAMLCVDAITQGKLLHCKPFHCKNCRFPLCPDSHCTFTVLFACKKCR